MKSTGDELGAIMERAYFQSSVLEAQKACRKPSKRVFKSASRQEAQLFQKPARDPNNPNPNLAWLVRVGAPKTRPLRFRRTSRILLMAPGSLSCCLRSCADFDCPEVHFGGLDSVGMLVERFGFRCQGLEALDFAPL